MEASGFRQQNNGPSRRNVTGTPEPEAYPNRIPEQIF